MANAPSPQNTPRNTRGSKPSTTAAKDPAASDAPAADGSREINLPPVAALFKRRSDYFEQECLNMAVGMEQLQIRTSGAIRSLTEQLAVANAELERLRGKKAN